jgi:predicted CopG family antitoxin
MYGACMASTNVNLNGKAYKALLSVKLKGESFSDVVLRYIKPKSRTCGELLDELEKDFEGSSMIDPGLMKRVKQGRGRRSHRPSRKG